MLDKTYLQGRNNTLLDYPFDWTNWLVEQSDTISSFTLTADDGLTISSSSNTSYVVTAWINITTATPLNKIMSLECSIVTASGRRDSRAIRIKAINAG